MILYSDEYFMKEAIREAQKAYLRDEVPVGAVVVWGEKIIARAHNLTETLNDVTAHAEMQAFTAAADYLGAKYLSECTLYVTIEPCIMCAGAAFWAQIGRIVYGARDEKRGYSLISTSILHPATTVLSGIMELQCAGMMKDFFSNKRQDRINLTGSR